MVIGIDATRANKSEKTGVEWYSYHVIRELAKLKTKHTYRLYFRNDPEPGLQNLGPNVEYRILRWPLKYLWTQKRLSLEMFFNPPDLLFIPAQIIPLIHPARTVTTIHDVAFKPYPQSYSWKSRVYLDLACRWAKKLPAILTVSEFSKKEITKYYGIPPEKIVVTYLGLSHGERHGTMIPPKFNVHEPYLLYVGRLERKKNITTLVKSFELIKSESWGSRLQLVLVGTKGHGWEEIQSMISQSPWKDDIKIIGWVAEEEKHALFSHATAFLLLSAYEGFGIPLLEAMDAGVPIVASDQAAIPEIAADAAILVPRGHARDIAAAVRVVVENTDARAGLIERGKQRAREFTWQRTAAETLAVFEQLLDRRPWLTK